MSGPYILDPLEITSSMLLPGTSVLEPDSSQGEVAWAPGANYVVGDTRVSEHIVWTCSQAHGGRNQLPSKDPKFWAAGLPSNQFAPFDDYESTPVRALGSITYAMRPGFFTSVFMAGVMAERVQISCVDPDGNDLMPPVDTDMWEQALGLWELLFMPLAMRSQVSVDDIDMHPMAQLTITVSNQDAAAPVEIGTIMVGEWQSLQGGSSRLAGVEYGAEADFKSNSYVNYKLDGSWSIVRRPGSINLRLPTVLNAVQADYAVALLRKVQDKPVAVRATDAPGYDYLNTVGLITGPLTASDYLTARGNLKVTGAI